MQCMFRVVFFALCCTNLGNIIAYSTPQFLPRSLSLSRKSAQNEWQKCARQLNGQRAKFVDTKKIYYDLERKAHSLRKSNWKRSIAVCSVPTAIAY